MPKTFADSLEKFFHAIKFHDVFFLKDPEQLFRVNMEDGRQVVIHVQILSKEAAKADGMLPKKGPGPYAAPQ